MKKHNGDLIASKDFETDIEEITGNLRIERGVKFSAKKLKNVGGHLSIYESAKLDAPALTAVGADLYVYASTKLDAPALTTVGADLYVYASTKLDALTTVGADLYVYASTKLDALTTVGGHLSIYASAKLDAPALTAVGADLYVYESAKLDALTAVGADLYVYASTKLDAPALTTVGADLYVYASTKLDALTTVGGHLSIYESAKLDAPALTTVGGHLSTHTSTKLDAPYLVTKDYINESAKDICKKSLEKSLKKKNLVKVDGILSFLISVKAIKNIKIFKVKIVGKLEVSFIVQKGEVYSHGKTIKDAKDSLKYKISNRDVSEFKKWKITESKSIADLIGAYRAITGACEFGARQFCESQKLKPKYTVKEVIELTRGKYGSENFESFFEKGKT